MRGKSLRLVLLPALLAVGVGACANNGVAPGYVNTASAPSSSYGGYTTTGEAGRVVAVNDTSIRGGGGSGNGPMVGGLLGGLGGLAIGASGGRGIGGGLIGGVLGAAAGAIGGAIFDRQTPGRGIEVTVQKDNGQTVTIAQKDDGDVQLGDRVQIVQDRSGTAKAVRDQGRQQDYQNQPQQQYQPAPQDYRQANYGGNGNYGPSQGGYQSGGQYGGSQSGGYQSGGYGSGPQPADYGQQQRYARPQSSSHSGYGGYSGGGYSSGGYSQSGGSQDYRQSGPQPQNDPRYGTLE